MPADLVCDVRRVLVQLLDVRMHTAVVPRAMGGDAMSAKRTTTTTPSTRSTTSGTVASPRSCSTCKGMGTVSVTRSERLPHGGMVSSATWVPCPDCAGG